MDDELKQYLVEMEERINVRIDAKTEKVETALLTAFHQRASLAAARRRTVSAALGAIDMEIEYHEIRIKKLEGGRAA